MKHKKSLSLLVLLAAAVSGAWAADGRVAVAKMQNGTVTAADVPATGSQTVTLTVAPAADYYITAADIRVSKTGGEAMAREAVPGYADALAVTAKSVDATGRGEYTFSLPDGYGAYVQAVFTKCLAPQLAVTVSDWTFGQPASAPSVSGNDGGGKVAYAYAAKGEPVFSAAVPTEAGDYTVKASVPAAGHYLAAVATADFTIAPAKLTAVTLTTTTLTANGKPQTVEVSEVKAGTLTVPAGQYDVEGNTQTEPGTYTVTVTGKGNFTGTATADFTISDNGYAVDVTDSETGKKVDGVTLTLTVTDEAGRLAVIDGVKVSPSAAGKKLTLVIPATVGGYTVTGIRAGALSGLPVTEVVLPDTARPLDIETGALPAAATVRTTLPLLDDYALMKGLQANFKAMNIVAAAVAPNQFWTFSSGVDVALADGLTANIAFYEGTVVRFVQIGDDELALPSGIRGIRACNGVLLIGEKGRSYDFVAVPGGQESGSRPDARRDAKSYGEQNRLVPVIEPRNYPAEGYAVLKGNAFHGIADNNSMVPACKAVLKVK